MSRERYKSLALGWTSLSLYKVVVGSYFEAKIGIIRDSSFWTNRDRDFIFHMYIFYDETNILDLVTLTLHVALDLHIGKL